MMFGKWMVVVVLGCAVLGGCNTVQGMGKDIEKAGEAIGNAGK